MQLDVLVKNSFRRFAVPLIAAVILFGASTSLVARVASEQSRKASLPELVHSGVFNPFPALYVFDAERNLVLSVRGPTDERFVPDLIAKEVDGGTPLVDHLSDAQAALLWRFSSEARSSGKTAFFLTIDDSMGKSELAANRLEIVREGLAKADSEVVLVVIRAGN